MAQIKVRHLKRILRRNPEFRCPVYIETGLHRGRRIALCAPFFEEAHGIELDEHWHTVSAERTRSMPNVEVHHGDTRDLLPDILDRFPATSCFVHLDAHFCRTDPPIQKSEFPLWDELALLRERSVRDIISVDDVHTFGKPRDDLRYAPGAEEWEGVTAENIIEFFGERVHDHATIAGAFLVWKLGADDRPPSPPPSRLDRLFPR